MYNVTLGGVIWNKFKHGIITQGNDKVTKGKFNLLWLPWEGTRFLRVNLSWVDIDTQDKFTYCEITWFEINQVSLTWVDIDTRFTHGRITLCWNYPGYTQNNDKFTQIKIVQG